MIKAMEEKKTPKKLSYTELENAAKQIAAQADAVFKENKQLRAAVQNLSRQNVYAELELMFKVVEHKDVFSEDFVKSIISQIEKEMTIVNNGQEEKEDTQGDNNDDNNPENPLEETRETEKTKEE